MKHKFSNLLRSSRTNKVLPDSQRIKSDFFPNDRVQIIGGSVDLNKQGIVSFVDKKNNRLLVTGCNTVKKNVRKSEFNPTATFLLTEMPIHFSDVQLVDPIAGEPTSITWIDEVESNGRKTQFRQSDLTRERITIPARTDTFKGQKIGPNDTVSSVVNKVTFEPKLVVNPFPVNLWNQMLKLRRHSKENAVF